MFASTEHVSFEYNMKIGCLIVAGWLQIKIGQPR
jgi:hypothetical protein